MRYFLDTEFYEDGYSIKPISLGMISEDGRSLYLEFKLSDNSIPKDHWLQENVLPHLTHEWDQQVFNVGARNAITNFIGDDNDPEFWAYFADYDWVLFCQLFGTMMDLPPNCPKLCMDLQQWWLQLGQPNIKPDKPENEHHALADARWNMEFWRALDSYSRGYL